MRCSNCGSEISPGTKFCTNCGAPVAGGSATMAERPFQPAPGAPNQSATPSYQSDPGAPTAVVRQKSGKKSPLVIVLIIVGVVAIMAAAGFGIGRLIAGSDSDTTVSESKESGDDSSKTADSDSDSEESESDIMKDFPGVDKDNIIDYSTLKDESVYKTYDDGDYSFGYPAEFFNDVKKETDGEKTTYIFTGTDGKTELRYEKYPDSGDPGQTVKDLDHQLRDQIDYDNILDNDQIYVGFCRERSKELYPDDYRKRDDGSCHTVVSGVTDYEPDIEQYQYNCSDDGTVYRMIINTPVSQKSKKKNAKAYMVDCLYYMFSKSLGYNSDKDKTSYKNFLKDDNR